MVQYQQLGNHSMSILQTILGDSQSRNGLSIIKSVQNVEITIGSSARTNTATISAVNLTSSILLYSGWRSPNTAAQNPANDWCMLFLTNSTTVTATTEAPFATYNRTVCGVVVEFYPWAIRSIQSGVFATTAASATTTVNAVNTLHSSAIFLGINHTETSTGSYAQLLGTVVLTNSTTVTMTRQATTGTITLSWMLIEFNPQYIASVNQAIVTIATDGTTANATIPAVKTSNCISFFGGTSAASGITTNESYAFAQAYLANSTTVTATRVGSGTFSPIVVLTIVEFINGIVSNRQSNQTAIASGNSTTAITLSPAVSNVKAVTTYGGSMFSTDVTGDEACFGTVKNTSTTNEELDRGSNPANTLTLAWEVVSFK